MSPKRLEEHLPLVRGIAAKLNRTGAPQHVGLGMDDLVSLGYAGLATAARSFDPARGVEFNTYAYYRIKGAMIDGLRQLGPYTRSGMRRHRDGSGPSIRLVSDDILATVAAPDATPEDVTVLRQQAAALRTAIAALPRFERQLVEGVFFQERTLEDIGRELGCGLSKSWASRLLARALGRLRQAIDATERSGPPPAAAMALEPERIAA